MNAEYKRTTESAPSDRLDNLCRSLCDSVNSITDSAISDLQEPDLIHIAMDDILALLDVTPDDIQDLLQDLGDSISPIVATRDWALIAPLFAVFSVLGSEYADAEVLIQELTRQIMLVYRDLPDPHRIAFLTILPEIANREHVIKFICQEIQQLEVPWGEHILLLKYFSELVDSAMFIREIEDNENVRMFFGQLWERYGEECIDILDYDEEVMPAPLGWLVNIYDEVDWLIEDSEPEKN